MADDLLDGRWNLSKVAPFMRWLGQSFRTDFLRRTLALACVVVVLALGVLGANPALHDQLHAGNHATADDGCAVVLFAGGVSLALPLIALPPPSAGWTELSAVAMKEVLLDSPRYLLQPERGPPLA